MENSSKDWHLTVACWYIATQPFWRQLLLSPLNSNGGKKVGRWLVFGSLGYPRQYLGGLVKRQWAGSGKSGLLLLLSHAEPPQGEPCSLKNKKIWTLHHLALFSKAWQNWLLFVQLPQWREFDVPMDFVNTMLLKPCFFYKVASKLLFRLSTIQSTKSSSISGNTAKGHPEKL